MEGHGMQWKHANEGERIERTINIDGEQGELREKWNKCERLLPMFCLMALESSFYLKNRSTLMCVIRNSNFLQVVCVFPVLVVIHLRH